MSASAGRVAPAFPGIRPFRRIRHVFWAVSVVLASCGGGGGGGDTTPPPPPPATIASFTADQASYFVGEPARLTAVFQNGSGRIDPGNIPVTSGQAIATSALSEDVTYRLTVTGGGATVTRDLAVDVKYRDRIRTLAMGFARGEHEAVSLPDGRVLILGGSDASGVLPSSVYQFDPATEAFSKLGDMTTGRVAMVAVTLTDGNVLVAAGGKALSQAPPAEIINGATGASMPTIGAPVRPRFYATGTRLADGRVLIAGGMGTDGADPTAEIYDPATGLFILLQSTMSKGRYGHSAVRLNNGRVFLYGGFANDNQPVPGELFDPATMTFSALPNAEPLVRGNHAIAKARDGRVWLFGGEDANSDAMKSVLCFDEETFYALGPDMGVQRTYTAAAPLTDGRLIVAGGARGLVSPDEIEATTDLMVSSQVRVSGPLMSSPRFLHTMTALRNGKVLIVGGLSPNRDPLTTAEIFE